MEYLRARAILAIVFCACPLFAQTAKDQLLNLRKQAREATVAGDQKRRLALMLEVQKLLHNSPTSLMAVAEAFAANGNDDRAIDMLDQLAEMGQADDNLLQGKDKAFARLQGLSAYKAVLKKFGENERPVSRAETAFVLPDANLLAEDIDY